MSYNLQYISQEFREMMQSALSVARRVEVGVETREIANATILPFADWEHTGCVIDNENNLIPIKNYTQDLIPSGLYQLSNKTIVHKTAIHLEFMNTCFGHWFTDNLSKMWYLFDDSFQLLRQKEDVILTYTIDTNEPLTENQMYFFNLLGIDMRKAIVVDRPMQFDKVIIPDHAFCNFGDVKRQYTDKMIPIWRKIIESIPPADSKMQYPSKIYLSRTGFHSGKDYGEDIIERIFRNMNYTIIKPETLPLKEQLAIVRNCDRLAATEGSVSHLALFCKPHAKVTIISKVRWVNSHQLCINEFTNIDVTYVEAHRSNRVDSIHPWWGPFYMCVTPYVEKYVGHPIMHLPDLLRPEYWMYSHCTLGRIYSWITRRYKG